MKGKWTIPVLASILVIGLFGSVYAASPLVIPAGFDSLTTFPPSEVNPIIPADFFGPGSDPFSSVIPVDGIGADLGFGPSDFELSSVLYTALPSTSIFLESDLSLMDTDTVIERQGAANLPTIVSIDTIPIEIVELNLVSTSPITVTFNGGMDPELWDVEVQLSGSQTPGTMTITRTGPSSGTFDSSLPVAPVFTFTQLSFPFQILQIQPPELNAVLTSTNTPWSLQTPSPIGGTFIPIDQTALLLAGVQSISMWMIPVVIAGVGIGVFVIKRRK